AGPPAGKREQLVSTKKRITRKPMGESEAIFVEVTGKHRRVRFQQWPFKKGYGRHGTNLLKKQS
ncbi:MAG: hypothetical protein ACREC4_04425, partial [Methylocella sp.]